MTDIELVIKAHDTVTKAIKYKELIRPETCEYCGEIRKTDAHHYDYEKPLDVVWLCRFCHKYVHRQLKEEAQAMQRLMSYAWYKG